MTVLLGVVRDNVSAIVATLCVVCVVLLAWLIVLSVRTRRLERFRRSAEAAIGTQGGAEMVASLSHAVTSLTERLSTAETQLHHTARLLEGCVQHVGLVRYDAFEDVGGQQSFSIALLDGSRSGIVITAIYSRTDVRLYTKRVDRGRPSIPLTPEESAAVKHALTGTDG